MATKYKLGITTYVNESSHWGTTYRHGYIHVRSYRAADYGRGIEQYPNDSEYYLKRINACRERRIDPRNVYAASFGESLTFQWQSHKEGDRIADGWYAGQLRDGISLESEHFELLQKVVKDMRKAAGAAISASYWRLEQYDPRLLVEGLIASGKYLPLFQLDREIGDYVLTDTAELLKPLVPFTKPTENETAIAA